MPLFQPTNWIAVGGSVSPTRKEGRAATHSLFQKEQNTKEEDLNIIRQQLKG